MTDKILDAVLQRARKCAYRRHSDAYRWLRARHAVLAPVLQECEPPMREIALEMKKGDIRGGRNKPVTARAVARIWKRVCRDITEERRWQLTGVKSPRQQPLRAPASWQPPVAQPQPPAPTPPPASVRGSGPTQTADPNDPPPGSMAYVRRQLEKMSGR